MSISVSTYHNTQSNNIVVDFGNARVWFSYDTPIAFYTPKSGLVRCSNHWGNTTGKHCNEIDRDKKGRLELSEFKEKYKTFVLDSLNSVFKYQ